MLRLEEYSLSLHYALHSHHVKINYIYSERMHQINSKKTFLSYAPSVFHSGPIVPGASVVP